VNLSLRNTHVESTAAQPFAWEPDSLGFDDTRHTTQRVGRQLYLHSRGAVKYSLSGSFHPNTAEVDIFQHPELFQGRHHHVGHQGAAGSDRWYTNPWPYRVPRANQPFQWRVWPGERVSPWGKHAGKQVAGEERWGHVTISRSEWLPGRAPLFERTKVMATTGSAQPCRSTRGYQHIAKSQQNTGKEGCKTRTRFCKRWTNIHTLSSPPAGVHQKISAPANFTPLLHVRYVGMLVSTTAKAGRIGSYFAARQPQPCIYIYQLKSRSSPTHLLWSLARMSPGLSARTSARHSQKPSWYAVRKRDRFSRKRSLRTYRYCANSKTRCKHPACRRVAPAGHAPRSRQAHKICATHPGCAWSAAARSLENTKRALHVPHGRGYACSKEISYLHVPLPANVCVGSGVRWTPPRVSTLGLDYSSSWEREHFSFKPNRLLRVNPLLARLLDSSGATARNSTWPALRENSADDYGTKGIYIVVPDQIRATHPRGRQGTWTRPETDRGLCHTTGSHIFHGCL